MANPDIIARARDPFDNALDLDTRLLRLHGALSAVSDLLLLGTETPQGERLGDLLWLLADETMSCKLRLFPG